MKTHALFLLLFLFLAAPAIAEPTIIIRNCYDGDTCTSSTGEKIRLACIDTPELKGTKADPLPAKAARDYLNGLVAGEKVSIRRITKDRYGRTVAEISKEDVNQVKQTIRNAGDTSFLLTGSGFWDTEFGERLIGLLTIIGLI